MKRIKQLSPRLMIGDFGCGEAKLLEANLLFRISTGSSVLGVTFSDCVSFDTILTSRDSFYIFDYLHILTDKTIRWRK